MLGDSKAEREEEWGSADVEEGSWYKRHFRESTEKVFEILGGDTLLKDDWKCGEDSWPLWGLYIQREERARENKEKEKDILKKQEEVFNKEKEKTERGKREIEYKVGRKLVWEKNRRVNWFLGI